MASVALLRFGGSSYGTGYDTCVRVGQEFVGLRERSSLKKMPWGGLSPAGLSFFKNNETNKSSD